MKKTGQLVQMIIQIVFIILNVTLVKSQATTLRPPQISTLYSTSYSYVISSMIVSIPAGNQTSSSSSKNETINNGPIIPKKSSSGLSTGAICAIAIPTIAALLGVAAVAALFNGAATPVAGFTAPSLPEPNFIDTSLTKFQIPNQIPIQQPQPVQIIEQPQPVQIIEQPQIIQPEPIKVVPRVDYPVNRVIEPPRVNNVFQQNIVPQQVQMVPIQEVQMVPVQEVEMVPVEQVEMQVAEAVPQVTEASISPATVEIIPQGQLGNQLISSTSQLMPQSQVLPTQVLPTIDHGVQPLPSQFL